MAHLKGLSCAWTFAVYVSTPDSVPSRELWVHIEIVFACASFIEYSEILSYTDRSFRYRTGGGKRRFIVARRDYIYGDRGAVNYLRGDPT